MDEAVKEAVLPLSIREEDLNETLALLEADRARKKLLPHLFGFPWYKWSWEFFTSRERECYLCAGNQLSKSSTQIRRVIHWATEPSLWPELWPTASSTPNLMWYLYPNKDVADEEWNLKWSQFMPQGAMKDDPQYGWRSYKKDGKIYKIVFNTGMTIIFKTYSQNVHDLQTGTVYAIACDEELPVSLLSELVARLNATLGYFPMAFTATLGQDYWRRVIEGEGEEEERVHAKKWQVSIYECQTYITGEPSPWTKEKIEAAERSCKDEAERQRRLHGKFVISGGLKISTFNRAKNLYRYSEQFETGVPPNWFVYAGVDIGSGGEKGHPAAIAFIAVSPCMRMGRLVKAWRGDGIVTTAADILEKYLEMEQGLKVSLKTYDWQCKDFFNIASRKGIAFTPAEKNREAGFDKFNTLLKAGMLKFNIECPEQQKLVTEILTLQEHTNKRDAKDDLIDAVRYALMPINWDFTVLDELGSWDTESEKKKPKPKKYTRDDRRRDFALGKGPYREHGFDSDIEQELAGWGEMFDAF